MKSYLINDKLYDIQDTPDYWMKQLINECLKNLEIDKQFLILTRDQIRPKDKNHIVVSPETTYDKRFLGVSRSSTGVRELKYYTIEVHAVQDYSNPNLDITQYENNIFCERVFATLVDMLSVPQRSFNFQYIEQTSVRKRASTVENRGVVYDMRIKCMFYKEKENNGKFKSTNT